MQENSNKRHGSVRNSICAQLEVNGAKDLTAYISILRGKYSPFHQFYYPSFIRRLSYLLWQPNGSQIIRKYERLGSATSLYLPLAASANMAASHVASFIHIREWWLKSNYDFFQTKQFHVIKSARINILNSLKHAN